MMAHSKLAIFLSGPIGAGKSTLGAALADALNGNFIEGDEHGARDRPWYAASLSRARSIVGAIASRTQSGRPTVIAYPLRCIEWTYYRRRLAEHGIRTITVSLSASYAATVAPNRGRQFSAEEHARIRTMIEEGYDRRQFSDFMLETDQDDIDGTLGRLIAQLSEIAQIED
jgi:cytidylate kinase